MALRRPAIIATDIKKSYPLGLSGRENFREAVTARLRHPFDPPTRRTFQALDGVSFEMQEGDVLGIVGRNGAGKSTLLKILSRITLPDSGSVDMWGRIGTLLEVGTGFHPELTGRENIYLNGAILGMRRRTITANFDAIVSFAEVADFIDTPVKRYSSGMYVRLAFAVAADLNSDIMILDEVLAVGDLAFQTKCLAKIEELVSEKGRTVLFVSHNLSSVRRLCRRVLILEQGKAVYEGNTDEGLRRYLEGIEPDRTGDGYFDLSRRANPIPPHRVLIRSLRVIGPENETVSAVPVGSGVDLEVVIVAISDPSAFLGVRLTSDQGVSAATFTTVGLRYFPTDRPVAIRLQLPALQLAPGRYLLDVGVDAEDAGPLDHVLHAGTLRIGTIEETRAYRHSHGDGIARLEHSWEIGTVE